MTSTASHERARRRIAQLCRTTTDARTMRLALLDELGELGFDAYAWLMTDPETMVGCAPLADVPCLTELPRLIRLKYLTSVNRWTAMDQPVALLSVSTGGDRSRSLLWRELLSGYDIGDVASVVFRDRFGCWGFLDLWRSGSAASFTDQDASFLASVSAPITAALRRSQADTLLGQPPGTDAAGPVVLLLSADLGVLGQTPETEQYLRVLVPPSPDGTAIPAAAYNVGAQLLANESGVDDHDPSARMHLAEGRWVTVRAARIGTGPVAGRNIAASIEATTPHDRMLLFGRAFGLTEREREIVGHLAAGCDTREVARRAFISEHTVQDHLKSIFAKTGSNSRRRLLSIALGS